MAIRVTSDLWPVLSDGVHPVPAHATSGSELQILALGSRKFRVFTRNGLPAARGKVRVAGIEFIDENGGGPGVRLRKRQSKKG